MRWAHPLCGVHAAAYAGRYWKQPSAGQIMLDGASIGHSSGPYLRPINMMLSLRIVSHMTVEQKTLWPKQDKLPKRKLPANNRCPASLKKCICRSLPKRKLHQLLFLWSATAWPPAQAYNAFRNYYCSDDELLWARCWIKAA